MLVADNTLSIHDALYQDEWNLEQIEFILQRDSSAINEISELGRTPLSRVLMDKRGSVAMIKLLLHYGADPNMPFLGHTPLFLGLFHIERIEVVKALIEGGARVDQLHDCALSVALHRKAEPEVIQLLLSAGGDLIRPDSSLCSPLFSGLKHFDAPYFGSVIKLLEVVDINTVRNQWGGTLLHSALCIEECTAVFVESLIDAGVGIDSVDVHGHTPLHLVTLQPTCQPDVVHMLLRKGSLVGARNRYGRTPLDLATTSRCEFAVVKLLMQYRLLEDPDFELPESYGRYNRKKAMWCFGRRGRYVKDCKDELRRMKLEGVGGNRTLFEFLKTYSGDQMSRNGEEGFDLDRLLLLISRYPLYSNVISSKFKLSLLRNKLKECDVRTVIRDGENCETREILLNSDCASVLANCLNGTDLTNTIIAFFKSSHAFNCFKLHAVLLNIFNYIIILIVYLSLM